MAVKSKPNFRLNDWGKKMKNFLWVEKEKGAEQTRTMPSIPLNAQDRVPDKSLNLKRIFHDETEYDQIMDLLVKRGIISEWTHHGIDHRSGKKGLFVVIVKKLHVLGYYKPDAQYTNQLFLQIINNTFNIDVHIDRVKQLQYTDMNVDFLPPSKKKIR